MSAEIVQLIVQDFRANYQADVRFIGEAPDLDLDGPQNINSDIWKIVGELIRNCVTNKIPDNKIGATEVVVTFEKGKLTVEDNFVYENPEEVLAKILQIRDSGKPGTTKGKDPNFRFPIGGAGIAETLRRLKSYDGKLDYRIKDRTIVAEVTWKD